ncbi:MAG: hypothetical protein LBT03_01925 [Holosporales bacterium]|nr:hypothetical protein [Holosporales bacterium]
MRKTIICTLSIVTVASSDCLFMDKEESEKVLQVFRDKNKSDTRKNKTHKVSGIFFVEDDNWTVWIDGVPYSSIGQQNEFSIDEVTRDSVSLTMSDGKTIRLSVSSN